MAPVTALVGAFTSVRSGHSTPVTARLGIFSEKSQKAIICPSAQISGCSILPLKQFFAEPPTRFAAIITCACSFKSVSKSIWITVGLEFVELLKLINSILIKPVVLICASTRCQHLMEISSTVVTISEPEEKLTWPSGSNVRQNWPNSINV